MPVSILQSDVLPGTIYSTSLESGATLTRLFIIGGLDATVEPTNVSKKLFDATTAAGMPLLGSLAPGSTNLILTDIAAEMLDAQQAKVFLTYRRPKPIQMPVGTPPQVSYGSSMQTVNRTQDALGVTMNVPYTPTGGTATSAIFKVDVQTPQLIKRFTFKDTFQPALSLVLAVGKINSAATNSFPRHSLLFSRCESSTADGGDTWTTVYEFIYNQGSLYPGGSNFIGWDVIGYYIDPTTNAAPSDLSPINGMKVFQVYPDMDMGAGSILAGLSL